MPRVIYEQTLSRQVEVDISDEELAALRGPSEGPWSADKLEKQNETRTAVIERALAQVDLNWPHRNDAGLEFVQAACMTENGEELFDVG